MEELKEFEYEAIKKGITDYGLNVAFLILYEFEKSERYYDCNLLNESIKRFCKSINLEYTKLTEEDILSQYKTEFWEFKSSGEIAYNNLPRYKNEFRGIFRRLVGERINRNLKQQLNEIKRRF